MRFTRKHLLQLFSLLLVLCVIYLPMMIHPPTVPKSKLVPNRTLIASEKFDRMPLRKDIEVKEHGKVKLFVSKPMIK
ncbi:hypothetical protein SAMN02982927_02248 [Sporolactobacillus nakayamae]|uniref:Uncharacterized protein n=1 Tax=Sporolactobacillus nakayamae TaxID=269670 RepID=A0A1I2TD18_9BACL|nr:hypothetical protein SAMN02982927_02248 [Sporolactobacillus nakayamae]